MRRRRKVENGSSNYSKFATSAPPLRRSMTAPTNIEKQPLKYKSVVFQQDVGSSPSSPNKFVSKENNSNTPVLSRKNLRPMSPSGTRPTEKQGSDIHVQPTINLHPILKTPSGLRLSGEIFLFPNSSPTLRTGTRPSSAPISRSPSPTRRPTSAPVTRTNHSNQIQEENGRPQVLRNTFMDTQRKERKEVKLPTGKVTSLQNDPNETVGLREPGPEGFGSIYFNRRVAPGYCKNSSTFHANCSLAGIMAENKSRLKYEQRLLNTLKNEGRAIL